MTTPASSSKTVTNSRPAPARGTRDAVESAIDASKGAANESWEDAAKKSNVAPWTVGIADKGCREK